MSIFNMFVRAFKRPKLDAEYPKLIFSAKEFTGKRLTSYFWELDKLLRQADKAVSKELITAVKRTVLEADSALAREGKELAWVEENVFSKVTFKDNALRSYEKHLTKDLIKSAQDIKIALREIHKNIGKKQVYNLNVNLQKARAVNQLIEKSLLAIMGVVKKRIKTGNKVYQRLKKITYFFSTQ